MRINRDEIELIIVVVLFFTGFILMIVICSARTDYQLKIFEQKLNQKIVVEQLSKRMK